MTFLFCVFISNLNNSDNALVLLVAFHIKQTLTIQVSILWYHFNSNPRLQKFSLWKLDFRCKIPLVNHWNIIRVNINYLIMKSLILLHPILRSSIHLLVILFKVWIHFHLTQANLIKQRITIFCFNSFIHFWIL